MQSTNPDCPPNFNFLKTNQNDYSKEELITYNSLLFQRKYKPAVMTGFIISSLLLVISSIITFGLASILFFGVACLSTLLTSILYADYLNFQKPLTKKSKLNKISLLVQRYPLVLSYVAEVLSKDELRYIDYINIYKLKKMIANKQLISDIKNATNSNPIIF